MFVNRPSNTQHMYNICKLLDQLQERWADVVQISYKCFVFAGMETKGFFQFEIITNVLVSFFCFI